MNLIKSLIALLVFISSLSVQAIAQAPRPPQLAAAKTVFISNGFYLSGFPQDLEYDQAYSAVQKLNRFTIVDSPQRADLMLEFSDGNINLVKILHIFDPQTHTLLWSISESAGIANRQVTLNKNIQAAVDKLAADLQQITTPFPIKAN